MKWTKTLVSILYLICFLTTGYMAEGSSRLAIAVPYLLTDLPIDWRPEDGKSLRFNVKVTKPPHYSGGKLTATLTDVTTYRGSCGNRWSVYNDLELRQDSFHNSGWRVESSLTSLSHPIAQNVTAHEATEWMTLRVDCADYAAYGKLTFATVRSSVPEAYPIVIKIPRDVNNNKIADNWRNDETTADPNNNNPSKNYVANWDEESGPAAPNAQRGDTLTVLDEYRGLYINGTWTDTDPEGWNVFIRSESGLGSAEKLPGMTCHLMGLSDVTHDGGHVMDYQASNDSILGKVYAIRLKNNSAPYDRQNPSGTVFGNMGLGPPSSWTRGEVFLERIRGRMRLNPVAGQTESVMIDYTVGHEIGHGVHLHHCPDHNGLNCYMLIEQTDSRHHVTQFHSHHLVDYDLKFPTFATQVPLPIPRDKMREYDPVTGTWSLVPRPVQLRGVTVTAPSNGTSGGTNNQNTTNSGRTIISTNTGSSSYGCGYNAEYDYCTDTGTCTTRTNATGIGMCGHRWCCCAPETTPTTTTTTTPTVVSTNTGYSSTYGCDYNAEYDYCTDTGSCTTRTGSGEVGMCGHRWCCCAPAQ